MNSVLSWTVHSSLPICLKVAVNISSPPCYLNSTVQLAPYLSRATGHTTRAHWQELLQLWQSHCCSLVPQRSLALQESFKREEWQLVSIAVEFCVMVTLVPIPLKWEWISYLPHLWGGRQWNCFGRCKELGKYNQHLIKSSKKWRTQDSCIHSGLHTVKLIRKVLACWMFCCAKWELRLFRFICFYFICMYVLSACMSVFHVCAWGQKRALGPLEL